MSARTIKGLATLLRNGGNTYQDFRMFLLKPEEAKEYADLLDPPPRFTEAQMALLKGFYEIGIRTIERLGCAMWATQDANGNHVSIVKELGLEEDETLDLAELFGKDGAEC